MDIAIILAILAFIQVVIFVILRLLNAKKQRNNKLYSLNLLTILMITNKSLILVCLITTNILFLLMNIIEMLKLFKSKRLVSIEEDFIEIVSNDKIVEDSMDKQIEKETAENTELKEDVKENDHISSTDFNNLVEETEEDDNDLLTAKIDKETGKMILIRYKKSYSARLNLSDDINKDYHTSLKNKLLSYKKIKCRVSWNYEAFNYGRVQAAKINVRGKSIFIYLPLNPNDFIDSKYSFKDCSSIKKYEHLPFRIKVKSSRGLKYAFELIEQAMNQLNTDVLDEMPTINYYQENRGFNNLLEEGLIKEIIDEDTFKDLTEINKEFLESNNIRSIDLQTLKHLKFNEDTIKLANKNVQGKKYTINIDTLSKNFNDGDIITISVLKEMKLIPKNAEAVKCLARGTLDKKLTLDLQDYSTDAIKMIIITGGKVL